MGFLVWFACTLGFNHNCISFFQKCFHYFFRNQSFPLRTQMHSWYFNCKFLLKPKGEGRLAKLPKMPLLFPKISTPLATPFLLGQLGVLLMKIWRYQANPTLKLFSQHLVTVMIFASHFVPRLSPHALAMYGPITHRTKCVIFSKTTTLPVIKQSLRRVGYRGLYVKYFKDTKFKIMIGWIWKLEWICGVSNYFNLKQIQINSLQ